MTAMNLSQFKNSLANAKPPAGLAPALTALWWAHAYLHRVEGDLDNARYWYRRAQRPVLSKPFAAEWDAIAEILLEERH